MAALRRAARLRGDDRGQAIIEFAILVPIFAVLLYGMVEMGRAWSTYQVVTDAARQGARSVALASGSTEAQIRSGIKSVLQGGSLAPDRATIEITGFGAATGTPVEVVVRYPFQFLFAGPWQGPESASQLVLKSTAVMRKE